MATINRLPIELLAIILLYADEKLPGRCVTTPSRKCFPFNAASVCNLWLDILKSYPQYWRHVLIDLADDPAPFLDTFFLFNKKHRHAALSITVFSSVQGSLALRKNCKKERAQVSLEGHRARTVFKHLEPSLSRYKNITFDLIYQSSLPPATKFLTLHLPLLTRMSLGCQVHNLDDEEIYVDFSQLFFPRFNIFPKLVSLSLTGRSFMELSLLGTNWLDGFKDQLTASFELRVTHFIFSELAAGEGRNGNQAFTTFVKMLCDTAFLLENIHLSDLFVDFDPPSRYKPQYQILTQTLKIRGREQTDLIFRRCEIPDNAEEFFGFPRSLELVDIPFHESDDVIDGTGIANSLYNALWGFRAHEVTLSGCAGVTDDLLNWLGPTGEDIFDEGEVPKRGMESLLIENCSGFTVGALRSFIMARAANSKSPPNGTAPVQRGFPFNTATACVLWLNILKSRPQYWKSVTFDVAHDPTPLLDTLGLYPGNETEVRVISTLSRENVRQHQEMSRVRKTMTHLRPYLSTCGSIEFNLIYQSSLPSCADILTHHLPHLSTLVLQCYIHDLDDKDLEIKIDWDTISLRENLHHPVFPMLEYLKLTGFSFMELFQLGPQWAQDFEADDFDFHISIWTSLKMTAKNM